jgi:Leucine-rich repeat (LRR) protein
MSTKTSLNGTSVPAELGDLTGLVNLTLADNKLTDPMPVEFGLLTKLVLSCVNNNKLTGTMLVELGLLTDLSLLRLQSN